MDRSWQENRQALEYQCTSQHTSRGPSCIDQYDFGLVSSLYPMILARYSRTGSFHKKSSVQAKEFGEAEVWMNERLMRAAPGRFAEFVTAFEERPPEGKARKSRQPNPLWLIWKFEGDWTLWNLMQKKDFPYNTETLLLGQEVDLPKGPQRSLLTIRLVMTEVCSSSPILALA